MTDSKESDRLSFSTQGAIQGDLGFEQGKIEDTIMVFLFSNSSITFWDIVVGPNPHMED